ncbi:MAG: phenol degradation protein meta [Candidatus Abyssobacteria bacterium SURF_5]|uniref:Phenol degradation protein meta n=1 Tax=Abyssobacteria bacterium (strain SURF_5) TaxID=2093360 RepID=A0A3A4NJ57_ABYX5|nr:MAG: phenol degradation protein meta [Candidatus Abyssubacteria bacterium SURF_5]
MKRLAGSLLVITLILFSIPALALNQPPVNLGFTNFLDGASPGPGWYLTEYFQFYNADDLEGDNGQTLDDDLDLDLFVNLNQIIYQSDITFLGGNPGLDIIVPLVDVDVDSDVPGLTANDGGFGDILVGPFIQWGPHMLLDRPYFHRFEFQVVAPTGKYSDSYGLNPGANVWQINPYYAFTYFLTPKLTTSLRFHYLWTEENDDHPSPFDVQAGQAIHFNYAMAYAVTDFLRLGVAGYYLKQLEEDEFDGDNIDDTEEEVFAIGPGLVWHITKDLTFMGAVNFETEVENRPDGIRSTLRLIWKFW